MVPPWTSEEHPLIDEEAGTVTYYTLTEPSPKRPPTVTSSRMAIAWYWIATTGLALFVGTVWFIVASAEWSLFSWHPIFASLSILSLTQGVLLLQQAESKEEKEQGTNRHKWLQLVGLTTLVCAFVIIVFNKMIHGKNHFQSPHAKAGLTLLIITSFQLLGGLTAVYMPSLYGGVTKAKAIYKYHRVGGYFIMVLMFLTALGGTQANWTKSRFEHDWVWLLAVVLVAIGIVPRINAQKMKMR